MHLLVPFAAPYSDAGRAAAAAMQLPRLQALLPLLTTRHLDEGEALSLSPPHERALGRALGWSAADGLWPWAAHWAALDGLKPAAGTAWGLLTPCHWYLGTEQVTLTDPAQLTLDDSGSRAFFDAVSGLFTSEGITVHCGAPLRWYGVDASLADLPSPSLDRVIGRNVDRFLGAAGRWRRLQSEVQMSLSQHPLNEARERQGLLPVNSFWLSGCGCAQPVSQVEPDVEWSLRTPALAEDWSAWVKAWEVLDQGPIARLAQAMQSGQAVQLTLCGERSALTLRSGAIPWWQRLRSTLSRPPVWPVLQPL